MDAILCNRNQRRGIAEAMRRKFQKERTNTAATCNLQIVGYMYTKDLTELVLLVVSSSNRDGTSI